MYQTYQLSQTERKDYRDSIYRFQKPNGIKFKVLVKTVKIFYVRWIGSKKRLLTNVPQTNSYHLKNKAH